MTRREMKKSFAKFLKDEGVFLQFKRNCAPSTLLTLFDVNKYQRWLRRAFVWADSPEGRVFWNTINDKWQKISNK